MENNSVVQLLATVNDIMVRNNEENLTQGKEFNIFHIQKTADDEVRICRLIRELLDPKGSHGQGCFFLRSFMINVLKFDKFTDEEYHSASVTQEEKIDLARRIDLVIHIKNRLFPIEVKIHAEDQINQCLDYYQYAARIDPETKLYYMTLNGREPSDVSKGNLTRWQYECISFSQDILGWLDNCINAQELKYVTPVREILIQFRNVFGEMKGNTRVKEMNEIKKAIESSDESMMAAVGILQAIPYVKADLMRKVFEQIKDQMKSLGFSESKDYYQTACEEYCVARRKTWPKVEYILQVPVITLEGKLALCFQIGDRLYFGIRWIGEKTTEAEKYVRSHLTPMNMNIRKDSDYYFWWRNLPDGNTVDFWHENGEYFKLFDNKGFEDYMKDIYSTIDLAVSEII